MRKLYDSFKLLLRNIPSLVVTTLILSVVCMNLFGGRELYNSEYICLNTGILFSWIPFICMDCVCKHFGTKAAIQLNIVAIIFEVIVSIVFTTISNISGTWSAVFTTDSMEIGRYINDGINSTFSSTWYVVFGSILAMTCSGIANALINTSIGRRVNNKYSGFAIRSLISTIISQFIDNIVFAFVVSYVLFGWNIKQVIICSITSMIIEFVFEAVLTPIGYLISKNWKNDNVGYQYFQTIDRR